ncbi:thiamine phosphate synthase [Ferruginibacter lapsinanis]|uniref:thiamine phosphate synthase n=1 Tax=Ferruginibacter lapsinanis TaxID=563172 RepID=UPI001E51DD73|nr:thiamine phosphate synthase [Ferruginibacter lapsinanis]UEG48961.1 thiamine phosphate synthase [Ferruginibacter lapsinanis]
MEINKRKIHAGIYLVIDPSIDEAILLNKLKLIAEEPIAAVQIWDNFLADQHIEEFIKTITTICHKKNIPVLINNNWKWLRSTELDGVHFDKPPDNIDQIRQSVKRHFICGITCNNDLSLVHWANQNHIDYISFCSVFPSSTSNSCELVTFENIAKCKEITAIPVFLAGGITLENMPKLKDLPFNGIAVISGIMNSATPKETIKKYTELLK